MTEQPGGFLRDLVKPNFLWGVALGIVGATIWLAQTSADWARNEERAAQVLEAHTRALTAIDQRLGVVEERTRSALTVQQGLVERTTRLEVSRQEDDKATQAQALRDAEWRAQLRGTLESIQGELNRLGRDVAPIVPRRENWQRNGNGEWTPQQRPQRFEIDPEAHAPSDVLEAAGREEGTDG